MLAARGIPLGRGTPELACCLLAVDEADGVAVFEISGVCLAKDPRGDGDGVRELAAARAADADRGLVVDERRLWATGGASRGRGAGLKEEADAAADRLGALLLTEVAGEEATDGIAAAMMASRVSGGNSKNCSTESPIGASCAALIGTSLAAAVLEILGTRARE